MIGGGKRPYCGATLWGFGSQRFVYGVGRDLSIA
jgi:hypothetical protein